MSSFFDKSILNLAGYKAGDRSVDKKPDLTTGNA